MARIIVVLTIIWLLVGLGSSRKTTTTEPKGEKELKNEFEGHPTDWCCSCCAGILNCNRDEGNATMVYDDSPAAKAMLSRFSVSMVKQDTLEESGSRYNCCCCCGYCLTCDRKGDW